MGKKLQWSEFCVSSTFDNLTKLELEGQKWVKEGDMKDWVNIL